MKNTINLSAYGHGFFQQIKGFMGEIEQDVLRLEDVQYFIDAALRQNEYLRKNPNSKGAVKEELKKRGCGTCDDDKKINALNGKAMPWNFFEYGLDEFFQPSIELFS